MYNKFLTYTSRESTKVIAPETPLLALSIVFRSRSLRDPWANQIHLSWLTQLDTTKIMLRLAMVPSIDTVELIDTGQLGATLPWCAINSMMIAVKDIPETVRAMISRAHVLDILSIQMRIRNRPYARSLRSLLFSIPAFTGTSRSGIAEETEGLRESREDSGEWVSDDV